MLSQERTIRDAFLHVFDYTLRKKMQHFNLLKKSEYKSPLFSDKVL